MLVLSQVFIWSSHVYYAPYTHDATLWGLSQLDDQKAGGGVMLVESVFTMLPALVWVLLGTARERGAAAARRCRRRAGCRRPRRPLRSRLSRVIVGREEACSGGCRYARAVDSLRRSTGLPSF